MFRQADTNARPIVRRPDELNACGFKYPLDGIQCACPTWGYSFFGLQSLHCFHGNAGPLS